MIRTLTVMIIALLVGCNQQSGSPMHIDTRKIQLTAEEKKYVADHKVVTWAVEENRPPFIYVLEGGEVKGISPRYLGIISQKTGLIFKPLEVKTMAEGLEAVKLGEIDLITSIRPSSRWEFLGFSAPYVYNAGVFVFRLNSQPRSPLRAGICKADTVNAYLSERFPDMKIIQAEDNEEAISLLEKGLLDVAIMNEASADYFARKSIIKMRKAPADFDYPYSFGFKKENVILGQILSRAIASISLEDKHRINEAWKEE